MSQDGATAFQPKQQNKTLSWGKKRVKERLITKYMQSNHDHVGSYKISEFCLLERFIFFFNEFFCQHIVLMI